MKKIIFSIAITAIVIMSSSATCDAQVLKNFGKKLEKKIEERIERKADRNVDKVLDKADKKTDKPIDDALNKPKANSSSKKPAAKSSNSNLKFEEVASRPDQGLLLVNSNCNDFSWFKKGSVLEYETFDNKGKLEAETRMTINQIKKQGSATVAEVEALLKTPSLGDLTYQLKYICDGDKIYMDIGAMMQAMMENNPELKKQNKDVKKALANTEINFDNGFASFPKKMYPGLKLEDLSFSIKTNAGTNEMFVNSTITDRQVIAKETVKTKAGTFECLKIRSVTNTSMKVMGFNQKMPQSVDYLWIAPKIGMIKQETQSGGKTATSVQLKTHRVN